MWDALCRLMAPPVFAGDEEKTRAAAVFNTLLWCFILLSVAYICIAVPLFVVWKGAVLLINLVLVGVVVGARAMLQAGHVRVASLALLVAMWAIATLLGLFAGGVRSSGVLFYLSIPVLTGLLLGRRGALTAFGVCGLTAAGLAGLEAAGRLPHQYLPNPAAAAWTTLMIVMAWTVTPLNVAVRSLRQALATAREQLVDRKQAEEALRERQETINAIVEASSDWIWAMDVQGRHTYSNPAAARILGYPVEEILRMGLDLLHEEDRARVEVEFPNWIAARRGWTNFLLRWRHRDGGYRYLESSALPIASADGELLGFRGVDRDVTDRIQAEESLRAHRDRLKAVQSVNTEIAREMELTVLLERIIQHAIRMTGGVNGSIFLWNEGRQVLVPEVWIGREPVARRTGMALGAGLIGTAAARRTGLIVNDYRSSPFAHPEVLARTAVTAAMVEPLLYQERLVGVVHVDNEGTDLTFSAEHGEILRLLAAQAAIAIENARLYKQVRTDLAERTRAEEALQRYYLLSAQARDIVLFVHRDSGRILEANEAACTAYGYTSDEMLTLRIQDLRAPETHAVLQAQLAQADAQGVRFETVHRRKDGTTFPVEVGSAGSILGGERVLLSIVRDISDRKRADEALRTHRDRLEALLHGSLELARIQPLEHLIAGIGEACARLLQADSGDVRIREGNDLVKIVGWGGHEGLGSVPRLPIGQGLSGAMAASGAPLIVQDPGADERVHPAARERFRSLGYRAWLGVPIRLGDQLLGTLNMWSRERFSPEDVAIATAFAAQVAIALQNVRLFQEEQQRREQLEAVRLVSAEIARELDIDRLLNVILRRAMELAGAEAGVVMLWDEAEGALFPRLRIGDFWANMPVRPIALGEGVVGTVAQTRQGLVINDYRAWAGARPLAIAHTTITASLGEPLVYRDQLIGVINLIHAAGRGTFSAQHGALLRLFGDQAAIAIENARLFQEEKRRRRQLEIVRGISAEIARELDLSIVLRLIANQTRELMIADGVGVWLWDDRAEVLVPHAWDGPEWIGEVRLRLGEAVTGEAARRREGIVVNDYVNSPFAHPFWLQRVKNRAVIAEPLLYRERLLGVVGANREGSGAPFLPGDSQLLRLFADQAAIAIENARLYEASRRELSDRKQAEEQRSRLETQLRQAQKMETVGRLAGGIAHDLNNLLTPILGYAELALMRLGPERAKGLGVPEIEEAAKRARDLTHQLLAFSRRQPMELKLLNLSEMVAKFEKILRRTLREDIRLTTRLAPNLGAVRADQAQLQQVLLNLIVNANDAIASEGTITVTTDEVTCAAEDVVGLEGVSPGPYVRLVVRDTGCGMDAEVQQHLFEPFYTTKPEGKGTGLGLATCYGIVRQHGGFFRVDSAPGRGSSFAVYIPRAAQEVPTPEKAIDAPAVLGQETILFIDDSRTVRAMLHDILRTLGYDPIEAATPAAAVQAAREYDGPIHLLITDVIMPGMNGRQLYEALRPVCPELKVLYVSGYTDDIIAPHGVLEPGTHFLAKPFTVAGLSEKIREALRGA